MAATVAPSVGNWEQPQAVAAMASEPVAPLAVRDVVAKYGDKGDQHDSGIDNSENLNSAESSSRSSPSAENKLRVEESKVRPKDELTRFEATHQFHAIRICVFEFLLHPLFWGFVYCDLLLPCSSPHTISGALWLVGRFGAFRPKGRGFESRSSRHEGTLGKSFTCSCLWRIGVKLRHGIVLCRERL